MRQTWEEIGIDLAERQYTSIGQLDDREITTSLGKRLLMILSPFVFLQVTPHAPPPDPVPTTSLHWIPLSSLVSPFAPPKWSTVTVDAASRLAPKHSTALRLLVRVLIGSMEFPAILLDTSSPLADTKHDILEKGIPSKTSRQPPQNLKLWGLSLGMMLDLMSYMIFPPPSSKFSSTNTRDGTSSPLSPVMQLPYQTDGEGLRMDVVAPSLASVFPRFSYPDVNFWIWYVTCFYPYRFKILPACPDFEGSSENATVKWSVGGKQVYEQEEQMIAGRSSVLCNKWVYLTRMFSINWSGSALSTFYAAIRKALVVVIVARALGIIFGVAFAGWWIFGQ